MSNFLREKLAKPPLLKLHAPPFDPSVFAEEWANPGRLVASFTRANGVGMPPPGALPAQVDDALDQIIKIHKQSGDATPREMWRILATQGTSEQDELPPELGIWANLQPLSAVHKLYMVCSGEGANGQGHISLCNQPFDIPACLQEQTDEGKRRLLTGMLNKQWKAISLLTPVTPPPFTIIEMTNFAVHAFEPTKNLRTTMIVQVSPLPSL